ncbi:acyltransferase family protein [Shewanella sp. S1-58-MNA-CIBAN-0166]|uniref:acyltransferase family protein n=1 Tax=Shewanella sp. S1-58-MNA-CIBAN-0166 TaxID=3140467 RepID=UPI00332983A9
MSERNLSLDFFKLIFSLMVVGIHVRIFEDVNITLNFFLVEGVFRIAVPFFIIVNGYYYHSLTRTQKLSWFRRVFGLYIFWSVLFSIYWFDLDKPLLTMFNVFFGYYHLWYVVSVFLCGVTFYLINVFKFNNASMFFLFLYAVGCTIQYYFSLYNTSFSLVVEGKDNTYWLYRNFVFFSLPFFYLGAFIKNYTVNVKVNLSFLSKFILISLGLFFLEVTVNYLNSASRGGDMYFSLIFVAPLLFLFSLNLRMISNFKFLGLLSSGIYFVHPFFIMTYRKVFDFDTSQLYFFSLLSSVVITLVLIEINKKLKFIL